MVTYTWNGAIGSFDDPNNWTPTGVPQAGDTADIYGGTCEVAHENLSQVDIVLAGKPSSPAVLDLTGATVGNIDCKAGYTETIDVSRHTIFTENIEFPGSAIISDPTPVYFSNYLTINLERGSILDNTGTIAGGGFYSSLDIQGGNGTTLQNNGLIYETTTNSDIKGISGSGIIKIDTDVIGFGTVELEMPAVGTGSNLSAEFEGSVGPQQTFMFGNSDNYSTPHQILQIDVAHEFLGEIAGFGLGDGITLANTTATSDEFKNGVLTLFNGNTPVAHLHFAGSYTTSDFALSQSGGNTFITHSTA